MSCFDHPKFRRAFTLLAALVLIVVIYAVMCGVSGVNVCSYPYNSYQLQAEAWLRGETALDRNYEFLELAVYNGNYYVSFPPVPGVVSFIWLLFFGRPVPGGLFQKIYIAAACLLIISELLRMKRLPRSHALMWGISFCYASAMLPITLVGGVWYEAQTLAFLMAILAIIAMRRNHPTIACIAYALSVGCRPFCVCLGPVLFAMFFQCNRRDPRRAFRRLIPGLLAGLAIAGVYAWYNCIRFGDPFEFGHTYLPEFQRAVDGQFSIKYIPRNIGTVLFGSPFFTHNGRVRISQGGFSMFLSCPILICGLVRAIRDMRRKRVTYVKWTILAMGIVNFFLLLAHRTVGGQQFGLRYALELIPFVFAWYLASPDIRRLQSWEIVLMSYGLVFNLIGGIFVHV